MALLLGSEVSHVGGVAVGGTLPWLFVASPANSDTRPPSGPATVSADPLPTVQVDGVAWTQVIVDNTVYAGGSFTTARPAGAAPGTQTVARSNFLAYDLTTGDLQSFQPSFNAQVRDLAVSPDRQILYVGGQFTQVNGADRYRIVAFNLTVTGTVRTSFTATMDATVYGIAATDSTGCTRPASFARSTSLPARALRRCRRHGGRVAVRRSLRPVGRFARSPCHRTGTRSCSAAASPP